MTLLTGYENYPVPFQKANARQTKPLMVVMEIEDVPTLFSTGPIYRTVRYGDPGVTYGQPGLVYGSLRQVPNVKEYMTLNGSLQIAQKLEPEQGKASITAFTMRMLDKDGDMTKLISPGIVVDELMGGKEVKIWLGYSDTSFPEAYFIVYRGSITSCQVQGPEVTLAMSDPASKKKTIIFNATATTLTAGISGGDTVLPTANAGGLFQRILGPDGLYDSIVQTYIKIDDEFMLYTNIPDPLNLTVTRPTLTAPYGLQQTGATSHAIYAAVEPYLQLGPENNMILALKLMLSGWNGPWITDVGCYALGTTFGLSTNTNVICLNNYDDAKKTYGLTVGDYITISNSATNNGTYTITSFGNDNGGQVNRLIYISSNLTEEVNLGALLAFRSKYDTLPVLAGLQMTPREVDVDMFEYLYQYYFNSYVYGLAFTIKDAESNAKDWIDAQIMLATKCYSLTRFGRVSVGYTRPPSTISTKLPLINVNNVIDPNTIMTTRAMNNRRFYNQIIYNFDESDGNYSSVHEEVNADSLQLLRLASPLTIESNGARTSYSTALLAERTCLALLARFGGIAIEITLSVNFGTGIMIEAGDTVLLQDNGNLHIPNFLTGERNLGEQLFEVIDRTINIVTGNVKLTLLGGIVDSRKDRYGGISPSSIIQAGSTTTVLQLKNNTEFTKWTPHVGSKIYLHGYNFSGYSEYCTLTGVNPANLSQLFVEGLAIAPSAGDVMDIPPYPTSADVTVNATYKSMYSFLTPSLTVVTGISNTQFTVSSGDAALLQTGFPVRIHNVGYSAFSSETTIKTIVGTTITTNTSLGFIPVAGYKIELNGFPDGQGPYRIS